MSDWIKIEKSLLKKPEVFQISKDLRISRYETVGRLIAFWSWCDEHLPNHNPCPKSVRIGCGPVTLDALQGGDIDDISGVPGFADAMVRAGWLGLDSGVYSVPKFDKHLSKEAKHRALSASRMLRKRYAGSVTSSRNPVTQMLRSKETGCAKQEFLEPSPNLEGEKIEREEKKESTKERRGEKDKREEDDVSDDFVIPDGEIGIKTSDDIQTSIPSKPKIPKKNSPDFEAWMARYNETAAKLNLRRARVWSPRMKAGLPKRIQEWPELWEAFPGEMEKFAEWVHEGTFFEFAWFLTSPENCRKLMEGKLRGVEQAVQPSPVDRTQATLAHYRQCRQAADSAHRGTRGDIHGPSNGCKVEDSNDIGKRILRSIESRGEQLPDHPF